MTEEMPQIIKKISSCKEVSKTYYMLFEVQVRV